MGAWIETRNQRNGVIKFHVASYMGAWIETDDNYLENLSRNGRILHGCVD